MYHSVVDKPAEYSITETEFEKHLQVISEAGFTAVTAQEVIAFEKGEGTLPEKPIMLTFDDGYENNYIKAFPLLMSYNSKAEFFVVGSTFGNDYYIDGKNMTPHFDFNQSLVMIKSGIIDIQYHTYAMHQVKGRDPEPVREGVLQLAGETNEEYEAALRNDIRTFKEAIKNVNVVSYPYGAYSLISERVFAEEGIEMTITTEDKVNTVVKGDSESLKLLGRINADPLTAEELKERLENYK